MTDPSSWHDGESGSHRACRLALGSWPTSETRQRGRARLHRRLRSRQGRVCEYPHRRPPPGAPVPPILPPRDGYLFLDKEKFHASFAGDLGAERAAFLADSQVPWGVNALAGSVTEPAWRTKPS
ncbi:MAG TPA: hypothetical protein VFO16_17080 [Pseudonocardiaceae bacterium]|nr:hypothetical protein [Pseudonocardiaceae bacterium]